MACTTDSTWISACHARIAVQFVLMIAGVSAACVLHVSYLGICCMVHMKPLCATAQAASAEPVAHCA
jgi:hypothetical protein